jgi:hypothetical protein
MYKLFKKYYDNKYFRFFYIRLVYIGIGFCLGMIFTNHFISDGLKYFSMGLNLGN